ncbi:MAG: anthranilate synthase component I, partial [Hyphomicrobiales bacterium]
MTAFSLAAASGVIEPALDRFTQLYNSGKPQAVWTRLVADLETPVGTFLKLAAERPNSFLLESVEGGAVRGRYSVIGFDPDIVWQAFGNRAEINRSPASGGVFEPCEGGTLDALRSLLAESRIDLPRDLPPMAAGVFGYMGYDMVRLIERLPHDHPDPIGVPDAILIRPTVMLIFDAVKDEMTLVTPVRPAKDITAEAALAAASSRLWEVMGRLDRPVSHAAPAVTGMASPEPVSNTTPDNYMAMVAKAKDYIAAGDIFQVVLSQRLSAPFTLPPCAVFRARR